MLMISFDSPIGKYELTSSTKFFVDYLKNGILENQVYFSEQVIIDNYEEKLETE